MLVGGAASDAVGVGDEEGEDELREGDEEEVEFACELVDDVQVGVGIVSCQIFKEVVEVESLTLGGLETGAIEDESEDPGAPPGTSTSFFDDAALLRGQENERGRNRANQRSTNLNAKRGGRDFSRAFGGGRGMRPLVKCHLCFKYFAGELDLRRHLFDCSRTPRFAAPPTAPAVMIACDFCMGNFDDQRSLQAHFALWHSPQANETVFIEFECGECSNALGSLSLLEQHMQIMHDAHDWSHLQNRIVRFYGCRFCQRRFKGAQLLVDHQRLAHKLPSRAHRAAFCGDDFCVNTAATTVVRVPALLYRCEICNREFNDAIQLKMHRNLHTSRVMHRPSATAMRRGHDDANAEFARDLARRSRQIDDGDQSDCGDSDDGVPFVVDEEEDDEGANDDLPDYFYGEDDDCVADHFLNADTYFDNSPTSYYRTRNIINSRRDDRVRVGGSRRRGPSVKSYPRFCCGFCRMPLQSAEDLRTHIATHRLAPTHAMQANANTDERNRNEDDIIVADIVPAKRSRGRPRKNANGTRAVAAKMVKRRHRAGILVHLDAKKSRENLEGEMIGGNERNFEMEMNKMECDGRRRSTRLAHSSRLRRIDLPDSALDATTVTVMSSTDSTLPPLLRDETRIARLYAMCSDGNVEMEDGEVSDGRSRPTVAKRVGDGAIERNMERHGDMVPPILMSEIDESVAFIDNRHRPGIVEDDVIRAK